MTYVALLALAVGTVLVVPPGSAQAAPPPAPAPADLGLPFSAEEPSGQPTGSNPHARGGGTDPTVGATPDDGAGLLGVSPGATLTGIGVGGSGTTSGLSPAFAAANLYYSLLTDGSSVTLTPAATDAGAGLVVTGPDGNTVTAGQGGGYTVGVVRGRNEALIKVTSVGGAETATYHVVIWFGVAPDPTIVRISNTKTSIYGGTRTTVTLRDGNTPNGCNQMSISIGTVAPRSWNTTRRLDPNTGLIDVSFVLPEQDGYAAGTFDVNVGFLCWIGGYQWMTSVATAKNAITYADDFKVTSVDVPNPLSAGDKIVLRGNNVVPNDLNFWVIDEQTGQWIDAWWWDYSGEDNLTLYTSYPYNNVKAGMSGSGPRILASGTCDSGWQWNPATCEILWSTPVNWQAPAPTDMSFSPTSGAVTGGTKVRLKGRYLTSAINDLSIKAGDTTITDFDEIHTADDEHNADPWSASYDIVEFTMPASATAGAVPITVTNEYGTEKARGSFTYAAKPAITSITPATVANTGGSVITVNGSGFGASGRPTVIINGVKSPLVTRSSDTKVTAVVPAVAGVTGAVDVQVSSAQGGGISNAAPLTLTAAGVAPVVSSFSPASAKVGGEVVATGSGFGAAGTAGVSVDGVPARVTASTATTLTFEVPATDTPGVKTVVVASTTGLVTKAAALTVLPENGITGVSPASIASYATGVAAKVTIAGNGFGAGGTVKVGSAAAVPYTATGAGTSIAGVVVPTGAAGSLPIVITPTGSSATIKGTVRVVAPAITYTGSNPYNGVYAPAHVDDNPNGTIFTAPTTGGVEMLVRGSGFGSAGTLKVGSATVATMTWTDTAITFLAPAAAAGLAKVTVTPTGSTLSAVKDDAVRYTTPLGRPSIATVASVNDLGHTFRNEYDPSADSDDAFVLTGANLAGADPAATRVTVSGGETFTVVPTQVTATSLRFAAPRGFTGGGWKTVTVTTDAGVGATSFGIYYLNAGATITMNPYYGLCTRTSQAGTGGVTHTPAVVSIGNSGGLFGASGTVTVDGTAVTPDTYNAGAVVIDMADLSAELANPWGGKQILITPADNTMVPQRLGFTCGVPVSVTTTANGSTSHLTIAAGTSYTAGHSTTGFIGTNPFTVTAGTGYEHVTAAQHDANGFNAGVRQGVPVAAGDYYLRVARGRAVYATEKYVWPAEPAPVRVTITGTPITVTPVSKNGATFTYRGALGDGSDGSPDDFGVTPSSTTDPITRIIW